MRNLKKVLSMALAIVMMLGMMTFATAAETKTETAKASTALTDMKDVANKEAVQLLVDLGVISGMKQADGTYKFLPKDNINRASYAKMIYFIMQGDASPDYLKGTTTGLVDIDGKDHWAEGYIAYCVSSKIANGDNNKKFNPDTNIAIDEAAKMLLTALGYVAEDKGYVGAMWSSNVMKDAKAYGLLKDVKQSSSEKLTRDSAAQLISNALFATAVSPVYGRDNGEKYVTSYTKLDSMGYQTFGMIKVTGVVTSVNTDGNAVLGSVAPDNTILSKINGKVPATAANLGQNVAVYVKGEKTVDAKGAVTVKLDKIYSSAVTANASTTYSAPDTLSNAAKDNSVKDSVTKYLADNGIELAADTDATNGNITISRNGNTGGVKVLAADAKKALAITGTTDGKLKKGDVITLIDTASDGKINYITIVTKTAAKLTDDVTVVADKNDSKKMLVTAPGVSGVSKLDSKLVVGYEGLKKDDVVLFYKDTVSTITYIEKIAPMTGKVTGTKGSGAATEVKVDGTYYGPSAITGMTDTLAKYVTDAAFNKDMTAYLDNQGNIFAITNNTADAVDYAVVLESGWVGGVGGVSSSQYLEAKILLPDATTEIVKVSKLKISAAVLRAANKDDAGDYDNMVVKYLIDDDGKYELTVDTTVNAIKTEDVKKGVPSTTSISFNNNTVFMYASKDADGNYTFKSYTGFKNAPSTTGAKLSADKLTGGAAKYVYVFLDKNATSGDAVKNYAYILDEKYSTDVSGKKPVMVFSGAIDGDTTNGVKTTDAALAAILAGDKGLYEVTVDNDGYVATVKALSVTAPMLGTATADAADGTVAMNFAADAQDGAYTYDGTESIYTIDGDTLVKGAMTDLKTGDTAYIEVIGSGAADQWAIKTIYIIKAAV